MKRLIKVFVLLLLLGFGVPADAPAARPSCETCLSRCAAHGGSANVCERLCIRFCQG